MFVFCIQSTCIPDVRPATRSSSTAPPTWSTGSTAACSTPSATARWRRARASRRKTSRAQLAVSRQPVLQALRLLKKDGLVQDAPGRGVLVAPLDADWIAQRLPGARRARRARRAAGRARSVPCSTRQLIDRGRKAARGRDVPAMIEADIAFHTRNLRRLGQPADRAERATALAATSAAPWARCCRSRPCARPSGTNTRPSPSAIAAGDAARGRKPDPRQHDASAPPSTCTRQLTAAANPPPEPGRHRRQR